MIEEIKWQKGDNMNKPKLKKLLNRFLIVIVGVFVIYSIYVQLEYKHYVNQSVDRNYESLSIITVQGSNLAKRLGEFVDLTTEKEENNEVKMICTTVGALLSQRIEAFIPTCLLSQPYIWATHHPIGIYYNIAYFVLMNLFLV